VAHSKQSRMDDSGFTLLEVILTLVILGYIISCIYPCLIFTIDAKNRVEKMSALNKVGQAIIRQVSHDLEGFYAPTEGNPFEGIDDATADSLNFVSTVESAPDQNGVRSNITEVGYRVEQNEQEPDFYVLLRREGFFVSGDPLKGGSLSEVYDRVKRFNLKYYDGTDWVDGWNCQEKGGPPVAVKIEFVVKLEKEPPEAKTQEPEMENEEGYFSAIVTLPVRYADMLNTIQQPP